MNLIKSFKNLFSSPNNGNKSDSNYIKVNKKPKDINKKLLKNYSINYYKFLFKLNYRRKKGNLENKSGIIIKVNKNNKNNKDNKKELLQEKNIVDKNFFYILKGAVYVIEDWWIKILKKNEIKRRVIHRNFNNKNFQIFNNKKYSKTELISKNQSPIKKVAKTKTNIINTNINKNINNTSCKKNNILYRNYDVKGQKMKSIKSANLPKNESLFQEQTLEETLINSDSCFFDFTSNNQNSNEVNYFMNNNIYNNLNTKDNNETKRENNIIYPIKEISNIIRKDLNKRLERKVVKNNIRLNKGNKISLINDSGQEKLTIPWEEQNNNKSNINSLEQHYELFKEIKSKIKLDSEILFLIQNNHLLKENPLEDSSIYINNSDLKRGELIRNVNVHIIQPGPKNISLKKNSNNTNISNTILNDDDVNYSYFLNTNNNNENNQEKTKIIKKEKNNFGKFKNSINKMQFENIYKN